MKAIMEDYPSLAEGNGLENRQVGKTTQEFESLILLFIIAGWSSLVARRAHNPKVVGSNPAPATRTKYCVYAQIAQSVEQRIENPRVTGSIPVLGIFLAKGIRACSSGGRALDF